MANWILTIIKAILVLFKLIPDAGKAELKRLEDRLQEIKNEQASLLASDSNDSDKLNALDIERMSVARRIAKLSKSKQKSLQIKTG